MSLWINGSPAPDRMAGDRGLNYGDGLFETMRVERGAVRHLDRHIDRLTGGCRRLGIDGIDTTILCDEIIECAGLQAIGTLKLIVTRGVGPRGYRPIVEGAPTRILTASNARPADDSGANGVQVRYCRTPATENTVLAGLKHLGRLDSVLARGEWSDAAIAEGLMRDSRGFIVGGTMTNLFAVRAGRLLTPRIERAGVRGVMRSVIMDAARSTGIVIEETQLLASDLAGAEELFLTNALVGIWPVRELDGRSYELGPVTRHCQRLERA
ncbi:MAG TPA: aminodeoxychorismate lyase [Steroidobacteraceae bacterium]|nr:aminodeoxychorismate lyase [Steroidobacteraceae bacterium]